MARRKREEGDDNDYKPSAARRELKHVDQSSATSQRITRGMSTDAARQAVYNTAELLEEIFEHLPTKQILAAQRVCRQFRDIVVTTKLVKRTQFPPQSGVAPQTYSIHQEGRFSNRTTRFCLETLGNTDIGPLISAEPNAIILRAERDNQIHSRHATNVMRARGDSLMVRRKVLKTMPAFLSGQKQSWEALNLSQPSPVLVNVWINVNIPSTNSLHARYVDFILETDVAGGATATMGATARAAIDKTASATTTLMRTDSPKHERLRRVTLQKVTNKSLREGLKELQQRGPWNPDRASWSMTIGLPCMVFLSEQERREIDAAQAIAGETTG